MFFLTLDKRVAWFSLDQEVDIFVSQKKRILVVDDEVGIGKLFQRLIEGEDLEVVDGA